MAVSHYVSFYQELTDAELAEERERLVEQLKNVFASQTVGSKAYSLNVAAVRERMSAVSQVLAQRRGMSTTGGRNPAVGIMRHDVDLGC